LELVSAVGYFYCVVVFLSDNYPSIGLAAAVSLSLSGHRVTVFESSTDIGEIGAGIQVTPNFTRQLSRWGLGARMAECAVAPDRMRQMRWEDSKLLTWFPVNENQTMERTFGERYYHIHRADLHCMLAERAKELGVVVKVSKRVLGYKFDERNREGDDVRKKEVLIMEGDEVRCDLVVAADGNRSTLNEFVNGEKVKSIPTGDSAYRALLTAEQVADPAFDEWELGKGGISWIGPGRHIVGYYVRKRQFYNLVVLVPDEEGEESWKMPGNVESLRKQFMDWDPRIQRILSMVKESYVWKLRDRPALKTWLHPQGNLVLVGDSAHPMLPYIGQGASSAVEDAAALAACLKHVSNARSVRECLTVYESMRLPRTRWMRNASRRNRDYFHMPDGELLS
jgi:salicylate hydroxylase